MSSQEMTGEQVALDDKWQRRTAESPLLRPREFFALLLLDVRRSLYLGHVLFVRDFSAKYRQTLLGYIWALLPIVVTTLLFIALNAAKIVQTKQVGVSYPLFVLSGTVLWQTFVDALMGPLSGVQRNRHMLLKLDFPKEAVVVAALLEVLLNLLLRLIIVGAALLFLGGVGLTGFALFSLSTLSLVLLGTVMSVIFVPLALLFHDVQFALASFIGLWFFATPVVYPLPESGTARLLLLLNPVCSLLTTSRDLLFHRVTSFPAGYAAVIALSLCGGALAWIFYRVAMPHVVERLGD